MALMRLLITSLMIATKASALQMVGTGNVVCEDLPVKMNVTWFCSEDSLCSFGESQYVASYLNYDGLEGSVYATEDDTLLVTASLKFSISGYETYNQLLLDEAEKIPVCGDEDRRRLQSDDEEGEEEEEDATCPGDGTYTSFGTNLTFPTPQNEFFDWAASGYKGEVVFEVIFNSTSTLVGQCAVEIQTLRSGSYYEEDQGMLQSIPSGRLGAVISLSVFGAVVFFLISFCIYKATCAPKELPAKQPLIARDRNQDNMEQGRARSGMGHRGSKQGKKKVTVIKNRGNGVAVISGQK